MNKISVKNLKETSKNNPSPTCNCSSWIDHWNKNRYPDNDYVSGFCRGCKKDFDKSKLNGGHVKKNNSESTHYIIPLCDSCNQTDDALFFVSEKDLILANGKYCKAK